MPKPQPTTSERQHESGTFSLVDNVIIGEHCDKIVPDNDYDEDDGEVVDDQTDGSPCSEGCVDPVCVALSAATLQLEANPSFPSTPSSSFSGT